jgi:hypothetical protein
MNRMPQNICGKVTESESFCTSGDSSRLGMYTAQTVISLSGLNKLRQMDSVSHSKSASLDRPGFIFLEESVNEYCHEVDRECGR